MAMEFYRATHEVTLTCVYSVADVDGLPAVGSITVPFATQGHALRRTPQAARDALQWPSIPTGQEHSVASKSSDEASAWRPGGAYQERLATSAYPSPLADGGEADFSIPLGRFEEVEEAEEDRSVRSATTLE